MDDDLALAQLNALLDVPGALKIVTGEHACGGGVHPDPAVDPKFDQKKCASFAHSLLDPRHFVWQDAVELEGPDERGLYTAYSAGGDHIYGSPSTLLLHLQRWQRP